MTKSEMIELDAWIAENVYNYEEAKNPNDATSHARLLYWIQKYDPSNPHRKHSVLVGNPYRHNNSGVVFRDWVRFIPTEIPAQSFDLLKKCAEKLGEKEAIEVQTRYGVWNVSAWPVSKIETEAPTLELAICQFAKLVFTKE